MPTVVPSSVGENIKASSMRVLGCQRHIYSRTDDATIAAIWKMFQAGKFVVTSFDSVKCAANDDRIPLNTDPKAMPGMVLQGYDLQGQPVLVPRMDFQNYVKWKRQIERYYNSGRRQLGVPVETQEEGHPRVWP